MDLGEAGKVALVRGGSQGKVTGPASLGDRFLRLDRAGFITAPVLVIGADSREALQ